MFQNIWERKKFELHKQKRRSQVVVKYLKRSSAKTILDIGCAEGYVTEFISKIGPPVVGIEVNLESLVIAKNRGINAEFINSSIYNLPFRPGVFDGVCILEVLEHLAKEDQKKALEEVNRILSEKGGLVISIPYKENIISTNCIHCGKMTPMYGHLRSLDESAINEILPRNNQYDLRNICHLPNVGILSCKIVFAPLPLRLWLFLNSFLGVISKGYWIVLQYTKEFQ